MIFYYAYMVLLVVSLILWIVIALREDGSENGDSNKAE